MKTDLRWQVKYETGMGYTKDEAETLLDLIDKHKRECYEFGVTKIWCEGRYTIKKYHKGSSVRRYAKIYKDLIKPDPVINKAKEAMSMMEKIINELSNIFIEPLSSYFMDVLGEINNETKNHDLVKTGRLINDFKGSSIKKVDKKPPFKHTIMKIPR